MGALRILPKVCSSATTSEATRLNHTQLITTLIPAKDAFILQCQHNMSCKHSAESLQNTAKYMAYQQHAGQQKSLHEQCMLRGGHVYCILQHSKCATFYDYNVGPGTNAYIKYSVHMHAGCRWYRYVSLYSTFVVRRHVLLQASADPIGKAKTRLV